MWIRNSPSSRINATKIRRKKVCLEWPRPFAYHNKLSVPYLLFGKRVDILFSELRQCVKARSRADVGYHDGRPNIRCKIEKKVKKVCTTGRFKRGMSCSVDQESIFKDERMQGSAQEGCLEWPSPFVHYMSSLDYNCLGDAYIDVLFWEGMRERTMATMKNG